MKSRQADLRCVLDHGSPRLTETELPRFAMSIAKKEVVVSETVKPLQHNANFF